MRPSRFLLAVLMAFLGAGLLVFALRMFVAYGQQLTQAASLVNLAHQLWLFAAGYLVLVALFDLFRHRRYRHLRIERSLPHSMALAVPAHVELTVTNDYSFGLTLELTDFLPASVTSEELPVSLDIPARCKRRLSYPLSPVGRGEARFGPTAVRILTRWKLWQRLEYHGQVESVKVYPNFAPIANAAAIGLEHQIAQLGIHLQQRRGEGSDFHQLREFREGDSLRQIDWKATARYRKPISREYQDERDQDILFLLDCGRRLRNKDDQLSHFDHALNALLLTSYIALRQGDAVGLMTFAGADRWLSPMKGAARINVILNQLFDLHSTTETSDYLKAAETFLEKSHKRSLVILVTNLRDEDLDDLRKACLLLAKKHIVMVASLRDLFLDKFVEQPVTGFTEALNYCGVIDYVRRRRQLLITLQAMGVIVTDSLPYTLHMDLVTEYLKLKRSGRL